MKNSATIALVSILTLMLSGCILPKSVRGPSGAKFDLKTVCNTSQKSRCSPTVGNKVPLLQQQIVMELKTYGNKEDVRPDLGTYLGTMVTNLHRPNGEPGTYCGMKHNAKNPFQDSDFTPAVYTNTANIKELVGTSSEASIQADIIKALTDFGVSENVIKGMKSKVRAEAKKLSSRASSSQVQFVEYRIKEKVLRDLEASKNLDTPKGDCMRTLLKREANSKKKVWKLYQAISGFIVHENKAGSTRQSTLTGEFALTADFKGKLKDLLEKEGDKEAVQELELNELSNSISCSDFDSVLNAKKELKMSNDENDSLGGSPLGIQARFNRNRCNTTTANSDPYFVAIGVSFWDSPRFHRKSNE